MIFRTSSILQGVNHFGSTSYAVNSEQKPFSGRFPSVLLVHHWSDRMGRQLLMLLFSTMAGLVIEGSPASSISDQIASENVSYTAFDLEKVNYSASSTHSTDESQSLALDTKIGSRPPSCGSKCKGCLPCKPVKVTVPAEKGEHKVISATDQSRPIRNVELDDLPYYNQVWRCRCKGNDYNP